MEDRCYIGDLYEPSRDQEWPIRLAGTNTAGFSKETWSLVKSERISNTTSRYEFQNPKFKIKLDIPSTQWIGKHYILSADGASKSRLYTNCSMLDAGIIQWREALIQKYENAIEGTSHKV